MLGSWLLAWSLGGAGPLACSGSGAEAPAAPDQAPDRVQPTGRGVEAELLPPDLPRFQLTSPAFEPGGAIPAELTCDGLDTSPLLRWSGAPAQTRSFVLMVLDPDAPGRTFVHWLAWNIPGPSHQLDAAIQPGDRGIFQGVNDFGAIGYGGPCPPPAHAPHTYLFRLYALDTRLELSGRIHREELEKAMEGHVLAAAELKGRYGRRRDR